MTATTTPAAAPAATPETRPAPVEITTPIRASEAIRLGCLIAPVQAFYRYTDGDGSACATKAMWLGGYGRGDGIPWPNGASQCPDCGKGGTFNVLAHLNDDHRWSREAIADWLEGLGL